MLGDVRDGAAVLSAEAEALDESEDEENEGGRDTDAGVARDDADQRRREAHAAQRDQKSVLAAHQIADPPENERTERPNQEPDGEDRDGREERCDRIALREELDRQDRRQAAEKVEVVPLDDVPNCCGDDDTAKLLGGETGRRHCSPSRVWVYG